MLEQTSKRRILFVAFLLLGFTQACLRARLGAPVSLPPVQEIEPIATEEQNGSFMPPTAKFDTPTSTPTEFSPAPTSLPEVTITAVKGNLFIRRGPDLAYNPIGVLYNGTRADAIARDVLSGWVQILIPNSGHKGWVSVQTNYSRVEGDLHALPDFTSTDWPVAAYLRNCTQHEMYILPGEITLPSSLGYPENETWLYPGKYTVYDLDVADYPEVMKVDIREGSDIEILVDGVGEHRKCP